MLNCRLVVVSAAVQRQRYAKEVEKVFFRNGRQINVRLTIGQVHMPYLYL